MALLARDGTMLPSERKTGLVVTEPGCRLPGSEFVTVAARLVLLPAVNILVAGNTLPCESQKGPVDVLDLDFRAGTRRDVARRVTTLARQCPVFALQSESGARGVVEVPAVQPRENEVPAVMFHMAARAVLLSGSELIDASMKAGSRRETLLDLGMTFETDEAACAPKIVAGGALGYAFETGMSAR